MRESVTFVPRAASTQIPCRKTNRKKQKQTKKRCSGAVKMWYASVCAMKYGGVPTQPSFAHRTIVVLPCQCQRKSRVHNVHCHEERILHRNTNQHHIYPCFARRVLKSPETRTHPLTLNTNERIVALRTMLKTVHRAHAYELNPAQSRHCPSRLCNFPNRCRNVLSQKQHKQETSSTRLAFSKMSVCISKKKRKKIKHCLENHFMAF